MNPNPFRGETAIILDGQSYIMRPTFEAIVQIEQQTGESIVALGRRQSRDGIDLTFSEIGVIVAEGIRAGAEEGSILKKITAKSAAQRVHKAGLLQCAPAIVAFLLGALRGETPGEEKNDEAGEPASG